VLRQALAEAQNDSRALGWRQRLKGLKKLVASVHSTQLIVVLGFGTALATRKGSLPLQPTEVVSGQIHDCAPQIEGEGFPFSKLLESAEQPHERVLGEIFGQVSVTGQQISELNGIGRVLLIKVGRSFST